jgi:hypothetical protein
MVDLRDDFWIQKRREWKGKGKGRSEDSCGENSILPKSLSISDSYPISAKTHALTVGSVGSLLSCRYTELFNTPELRGIVTITILHMISAGRASKLPISRGDRVSVLSHYISSVSASGSK